MDDGRVYVEKRISGGNFRLALLFAGDLGRHDFERSVF
jgi:hypothetical protein